MMPHNRKDLVVGARVQWTDHLDQTHKGYIETALSSQYLVRCEDGIVRFVRDNEPTLRYVPPKSA